MIFDTAVVYVSSDETMTNEELVGEAQKPWIVSVLGIRKITRIEEKIGAADIVLTKKELEEMNKALDMIDLMLEHWDPNSDNAKKLVGKTKRL